MTRRRQTRSDAKSVPSSVTSSKKRRRRFSKDVFGGNAGNSTGAVTS
ncbi:MAG: hypothetical protein GY822_02490 [Deltaproteobacteria bacterium]|nr:hypothetical protein [Deltaproteobacteria bacterium]